MVTRPSSSVGGVKAGAAGVQAASARPTATTRDRVVMSRFDIVLFSSNIVFNESPRHRRDERHLQRGGRGAAPPAALPGGRPAGTRGAGLAGPRGRLLAAELPRRPCPG